MLAQPTILLFLGVTFLAHNNAAEICGTNVSLFSEQWGRQHEVFNVTISFKNVTNETLFTLLPDWDALEISKSDLKVVEDSEVNINMTSNQFYLYKVRISCLSEQSEEEAAYFEVPVSRTVTSNTVAFVFQRVMTVFIAFAMLLMGCELKFEIVKSYLVKPLAPAAGMFCQYVCMPVMAYIIGYFIFKDNLYARYGLILIGCAPGGSFSNFWAAIWGGDLDLSVTMTFCSTIASFGFTTFWVWLFGRYVLSADKPIDLPYLQLFVSLISLVVPVFIGLLITYKQPELSAKLVKLSRPFFIFMMLIVSTLGIYTNIFFFSVASWYHLVAPSVLGIAGYGIGILASSLLCLKKEQIIALSLETAIQNAGIAIMILQSNMASPYGDMCLLPVLGYIITSSGPLNIIMYSLYRLATFLREKTRGSKEDGEAGKVMSYDNKAYNTQ